MRKYIFYLIILALFLVNQHCAFAFPVTVDSNYGRGLMTSITIVNGNPAICYYDAVNKNLKYIRASDATGITWHNPVTVLHGCGISEASSTSMTIVNNSPAICYYDSVKDKLKYVRASDTNGAAWNPPVSVLSDKHINALPSLVVVNGNPAICYCDSTNGDLKYIRALDIIGTAWGNPVIIDSKNDTGYYASMTIVNGSPAISYCEYANGDLKYVRASDTLGTAWGKPVTIDSNGETGYHTSMTISNGSPAICYYDYTKGDLKYVRASDASGSSWGIPVTIDSKGDVGKYSSMTIVNGNPAISYYDNTKDDLKYVIASDGMGTAWGKPVTIDSKGDVGEFTSIICIGGSPAISYFDSTNFNLKCAMGTQLELYFPHIASNKTWETEICIINTNDSGDLKGVIICYDNSGMVVGSKNVNLPHNGRISLTISQEFNDPSKIGYITFRSYSAAVYGYTKFYIAGKYRVAIPATYQINSRNIFIPHIASNNEWWTGLSLINTASFARTMTIEFNNGKTKSIILDPWEHGAFSIAKLFSNIPQPDIKSAVIKNASGVIGLELFGSSAGTNKNYLSGILLKDETTKSIYYPHIASNTVWWTGIVAYNPEASKNRLTITPYKSDGTKLQDSTITLDGKAKYIGTVGSLKLPKEAAWINIEANSAITGFELFGKHNGKQLAGYTGVNINSATGVFPKLEKSGWTGIAFVNSEDVSASITLKAFDDSGKLIAQKKITLKSHAKIVKLANDLFNNSIAKASYITYQSDNYLVGFQLNGSTNNMLLDALPGN